MNLNTSKSKVMCINAAPDAAITVDSEPLDFAGEFTYPGSLATKDIATEKDVKTRRGGRPQWIREAPNCL